MKDKVRELDSITKMVDNKLKEVESANKNLQEKEKLTKTKLDAQQALAKSQ